MGTVILTWNIQWGRNADGHVSLARQLKQAQEMAEFDVLCLQEVTSGFSDLLGQPGADRWSELADAPGSEYTVIDGFALERRNDAHVQRFGDVIATRPSVHYIQRHALPCPPDTTPYMPRMVIEVIVQAALGVLRTVITHLEYYSELQRVAQIDVLRVTHTEGCARANQPVRLGVEPETGPFRPLAQTKATVIRDDFNCKADSMLKRLATTPFAREPALHDAQEITHGVTPRPPTFGVYDRADRAEPAYACDFILISEPLKPRVLRLEINNATQVSDHQPMLLELQND